MFLDDTACNLASLNLVKFYDDETTKFDTEKYSHAIRLWTVALEISVLMAQFPSEAIAQRSYDYRTLGLGYANIGSLLMRMGFHMMTVGLQLFVVPSVQFWGVFHTQQAQRCPLYRVHSLDISITKITC